MRRDLRNEGMRSFRRSSRVRRIVAAKMKMPMQSGQKFRDLLTCFCFFEGSPLRASKFQQISAPQPRHELSKNMAAAADTEGLPVQRPFGQIGNTPSW